MLDWYDISSNLSHMLGAYLLALPLGWDQEKEAKSAGLRTFPLVSVAACGYMLTGIAVFDNGEPQSRVAYGLITGIGFIGGGAILKKGSTVTGTATAASLWNTGAIGMAVAWNLFEIAIMLCVLNFITLIFIRKMKDNIDGANNDKED
jgi:putative Mg2+ transporter-C (MgtC) family protein